MARHSGLGISVQNKSSALKYISNGHTFMQCHTGSRINAATPLFISLHFCSKCTGSYPSPTTWRISLSILLPFYCTCQGSVLYKGKRTDRWTLSQSNPREGSGLQSIIPLITCNRLKQNMEMKLNGILNYFTSNFHQVK